MILMNWTWCDSSHFPSIKPLFVRSLLIFFLFSFARRAINSLRRDFNRSETSASTATWLMSTSADSDWSIWRDDRWLGPRSVICNRLTRVFIERRRRESWLIWHFDALSFVGDKCPIEDIRLRLLRPCRRQSSPQRDECTYLDLPRDTAPWFWSHKSKLFIDCDWKLQS